MSGTLHLDVAGEPPVVVVTREGDVPEALWFEAQVALSAEVRGSRLIGRLEALVSRRSDLGAAVRRHGCGLTAGPGARAVLQRVKDTRTALDAAEAREPLSPDDVTTTLAGTRFSRSLRPFQLEDAGRLLALAHGANFSIPGAGKTTVTLAVYEARRAAGQVDRLLVVAPLSAFEAWVDESAACLDPAPVVYPYETGQQIPADAEIVVVNYQRISQSEEALTTIRQWALSGKPHIVLDEAHRIKRGRGGSWGSTCLDLAWVAERRDVLTGTPAPNHPRDLEALLEFLWPGRGRALLPPVAFDNDPPPTVGRQVAERIRPLFVRTRKSQLELDPPTFSVVRLPMAPLHAEIYKAITDRALGEFTMTLRDQNRFAAMQRIVMYLLEAASNPKLLPSGSDVDDPVVFRHPPLPIEPGSSLADLLVRYEQHETPTKFRKLAEMIRDNAEAGRKTLVWTNFVRNFYTLEHMLARYRPAKVHGGIPSATSAPNAPLHRETELQRFRGDDACMVLLANPAAMSEGVSLHHTCHDAIYLERTFNAGQYLQSVDRIHRLGLEPGTETRISFLVTEGTIDEVVYDRVRVKAERLGQMMEDPDIVTMTLPDADDIEDVTSGLGRPVDDEEDVRALFEFLRGE